MSNKIFLFFIFSLLISICAGEVIKEKTSDEYRKDLGGYDGNAANIGSGSPRIVFPSEASPMNVTWQVISPKREEGYYLDDVIVVQVTVTSVNKEGLEDLEIWEIPGDGIEVLNCSYPIVTSVVGRILDYEKSDKSFLRNADINLSSVIMDLKSKNKPKEIKCIYGLLPNNTQKNVTNIDLMLSNRSDRECLRSELLREFNTILDNRSSLDFNASFFNTSPTVFNDGLDYWIKSEDKIKNFTYIELEDYRLIKRRLLEYAFWNETAKNPEGIRRLSFDKEHENLLSGPVESINYFVHDLHDRVSITLKYYLHPTKIGLTNLRSIIRSKDHLHEKTNGIRIVERNPLFESKCSCETTDLIKNTSATFVYSIKYLGGDMDERKEFKVHVSSPGHCKIIAVQTPDGEKSSRDMGVDNKSITLDFTKGMTQELKVIASYNITGSHFLPPKISIDRYTSDFEGVLSVSECWDPFFRVHSEAITQGILFLTLLLLLLSTFGTIFLQYKLLKIAENDSVNFKAIADNTGGLVSQLVRDEETERIQKLIENNTDALANLTKLIARTTGPSVEDKEGYQVHEMGNKPKADGYQNEEGLVQS